MVGNFLKKCLSLQLFVAASLFFSLPGFGANNLRSNNSEAKLKQKQPRTGRAKSNKPIKKNNQAPPKQQPANAVQAATSTATKSGKLSGQELYLKAREFFAVGRYPETIKYAAAAGRRLPKTNLPTVLMAQSYYRLGMNPRAAKLFSQISIDDLPKEAAIDYILTMFAARRFREVIKAFSVVPEGHPYKDVARFYAGVSFLQFKLYQKAQYYLRSSRKLPPSLNSQRRRLLSEIDDVLDQERRGVFDQSQPYSYQSPVVGMAPLPSPEVAEPILPGGTPGAAKEDKAPPPTPPTSSTTFAVRPSMAWNQTNTRQDFNGLKQSDTTERSPSAAMNVGLKHLGSPRSFGGQPSIELNLTPSYSHSEKITNSSSLVADSASPDNVQNVSTKKEETSYVLTNAYSASGLYPISDPLDISAGFSEKHDYLSANMKKEITTRSINGKAVIEVSSFKLDAAFTNDSVTNRLEPEKNKSTNILKGGVARNGETTTVSFAATMIDNAKPKVDLGIKSVMAFDLGISRNFEDVTGNIGVNQTTRERIEGGGNGIAMSEMSGKVEGIYSMSFGLSVIGAASYQQLSNYMVVNSAKDKTDGPTEASAKGTAKKFGLTLKVSPASYASVTASYEYTDRALTADDPSFEKKLASEHWSQQTVTKIGLNLSYSF